MRSELNRAPSESRHSPRNATATLAETSLRVSAAPITASSPALAAPLIRPKRTASRAVRGERRKRNRRRIIGGLSVQESVKQAFIHFAWVKLVDRHSHSLPLRTHRDTLLAVRPEPLQKVRGSC